MSRSAVIALIVPLALAGCTERLHRPSSPDDIDEMQRGGGLPRGGPAGGPGVPAPIERTPPSSPSPLDPHD